MTANLAGPTIPPMSEVSAAYWRDIRRRALKPASKLDWAETVLGWLLFLGLLLYAVGRDRALEELTTTGLYALAAVTVGGVFLILRLGQAAFASHSDSLKTIQHLESERDALRAQRDDALAKLATRRRNQELANELELLRASGLHSIRNELETNRSQFATYKDRESRWAQELLDAMTRSGCTEAEIGSVMNISNSEIGRAAAGANYGADENWLIGLLEMRLARLRVLIDRYGAS